MHSYKWFVHWAVFEQSFNRNYLVDEISCDKIRLSVWIKDAVESERANVQRYVA